MLVTPLEPLGHAPVDTQSLLSPHSCSGGGGGGVGLYASSKVVLLCCIHTPTCMLSLSDDIGVCYKMNSNLNLNFIKLNKGQNSGKNEFDIPAYTYTVV